MRCLTLAIALRQEGAVCYFLCRDFSGSLIDHVEQNGFRVFVVGPPISQSGELNEAPGPILDHADWLGGSQMSDAETCRIILKNLNCDWLVVDHYALDFRWEGRLRRECKRLFVIDDLADRQHLCDVLLDQNLGTSDSDYSSLTEPGTTLLIGPHYSLLRPDFFSFRELSLTRRAIGQVKPKHIVVSMGGVDVHNATGRILEGVGQLRFDPRLKFTVILGRLSPWIDQVRVAAELCPSLIEVAVGVANMAELLSSADFVIGAAGSSSWERCCLGVPTLLVILAENQRPIAEALDAAGVALSLGSPDDEGFVGKMTAALEEWLSDPRLLDGFSQSASRITDGSGTNRVVSELMVDV